MDVDGRGHYAELQALRGVAALTVLIGHCIGVYALPVAFVAMLEVVINAHAAVILFFVLSGFVLSIALERRALELRDTLGFYVRRLFRVYPAVLVATALTLVAFLLAGPSARLKSAWLLHEAAPHALSPTALVASFLALSPWLLPPIWTILIELVGSFFMPILARLQTATVVAAVLILSFWELASLHRHGIPSFLSDTSYLVFFTLGCAVFQIEKRFGGSICLRPSRWRVIAALGALTLVLCRTVIRGRIQPIALDYNAPLPALVEGVAAFFLILPIVAGVARFRLLRTRVLDRLGNISFSLYLTHYLVILVGVACIPIMSPLVETFSLLVVVLVITLPLSTIMEQRIERPFNRLGRRIEARFYPPAGAPVQTLGRVGEAGAEP